MREKAEDSNDVENGLLAAALRYADRGWRVHPLYSIADDGDCMCDRADCDDQGKHPRTKWGETATTDKETIREWWDRWPRANIAVATGRESGIVVFDVDDVQATLDDIGHRKLPKDGVRARTGKGRHFYFAHPGDGEEIPNENGSGWDVRGDGGYIILPPSRHYTGARYRWQNSPDEGELYPPPDWLPQVMEAKRRGDEPSKAAGPVAETIPEGQRNSALTSYAGTLRRRGANEEEIYAALQAMNEHRCNPPLDDREVRRIAESIASYEATDPLIPTDPKDLHNGDPDRAIAELKAWKAEKKAADETLNPSEISAKLADVVEEHRHVVAIPETEELYWWDAESGLWKPEGRLPLSRILDAALPNQFAIERVNQAVHRLTARHPHDLDDLGTPEGTIAIGDRLLDVETHETRQLRPEDRALTNIPVDYDPDAEAPQWAQFLEEVVPHEPARKTLREFIGYVLLQGRLPFHKGLMMVGSGRNGKSTFISVVEGVLGEYNLAGEPLQRLNDSNFALANLFGKLANIYGDLEPKSPRTWSTFKTITGGDRVSAERKFEPSFTFRPTAKLIFSCNQVPDPPEGAGDAFYRRWLLVEFPRTIPVENRIADLEERILDAEKPGVLNWALGGLDRLLDQGQFTAEETPDEVEARWKRHGSSIHRFAHEACVYEEAAWMSTGDVYDAYQAFCEDHPELEVEAQATVTKTLKRLGPWRHYNHNDRGRGFSGLSVPEYGSSGTGSTEDLDQW